MSLADNKKEIAAAGAIPPLVQLLTHNSSAISSTASGILRACASDERLREEIRRCGVTSASQINYSGTGAW
mgnify:CR=1 FL=1